MSNFKEMQTLIVAMSGQENILAVNKVYMRFMGSLEGGTLLSQIIFLSDKSSRKDGFFWKSYKDWYEHTFISEHNIKKLVARMKEMGFLETKLIKANGAPTLHYKFDMDAFITQFQPFLKILGMENENFKNGILKNQESLTEITTEITNKEKDIKTLPQQVEGPSNKQLEEQFDQWYSFYPKKVNKKKAFDKFKLKVKKHGFEKVFEGMTSYAKVMELNGTDKQYIKGPDVFLNGEHYLDDQSELLKQKPVNQQQSYKPWEGDLFGTETNSYANDNYSQQLPKPTKQIGW